MKDLLTRIACFAVLTLIAWTPAATAQQIRPNAITSSAAAGGVVDPKALSDTSNFVIGVGDILSISFWREQTMSGDAVVRPDGKISLPLLNDVQAVGYTPEELARALAGAAVKFVDDPDVTVIVKEIHSRKVYLVGQVMTPGMYSLSGGDMNVLQLLAMGGGVLEYANKKNIVITRTEERQQKRFKFNYDQVLKGKNPKQNILLEPGDTVVVP